MTLKNQSGQTLLIAVLIVMILMISIPMIIYLNQMGTFHQVASQKRQRSRLIAEEGVGYAIQQFSTSQTAWSTNALGGLWGAAYGNDCNTGSLIPSPSGAGQFKLICSNSATLYPGLQPSYQVAVVAVAYMPDTTGAQVAQRAVQAFVSQRTLGADLSSGFHLAAAVELALFPLTPSPSLRPFVVHWGPVVCLDDNFFPLKNPMDQETIYNGPGYPRIISIGGITGTAYTRVPNTATSAATSDLKQYWAFAPMAAQGPSINEASYIFSAQHSNGITPPTGAGVTTTCVPPTNTCGYFNVSSGYALFDGGYTATTPGTIIYVNGDAHFGQVHFDGVTVIVTSTLTLVSPGTAGGATISALNVPITAPLEYPYWISSGVSPQWPCSANPGSTCSSTTTNLFPAGRGGFVDFRGFLYVKGDMILTGTPAYDWDMAGTLMVGDPTSTTPGRLQVNVGSLTVAYDNQINHAILMNPEEGTTVKIVTDSLLDVPVP